METVKSPKIIIFSKKFTLYEKIGKSQLLESLCLSAEYPKGPVPLLISRLAEMDPSKLKQIIWMQSLAIYLLTVPEWKFQLEKQEK